ncbi:MAG: glycosyltransferase family 2 protein [Anaerolineae bacterium]|nr:glycosyltransferase family 2 protein [Anaerolineae bacterium]
MHGEVRPLVTIGIPTYKRADSYLRLALESALAQTYPEIEVIVSDNCSPDHTQEVVRSFSDLRLRYFRQKENIGPNNNFNFCLEQARGDYFLLLQDDDQIDSDFVATCMEAANYATDVGIIRTGTRVIDEEGNILWEKPNRVGGLSTTEFFRGWFRGKTSPYLCSTIFNTRRLKEIGGFRSPNNLFQDVTAEFQLAARFGRVDVLDVKASFRKHGSEMTFSAKVHHWCEDSRYLLDLMCELVGEEDALVIRREGRLFFSRFNYNLARGIPSPLERWATYWMIYRTFDYQYPPFYFYVYRKNLRKARRAARRVKRFLYTLVSPASPSV